MLLRHILAATDESDAGRQAIRTAANLAARSSARLTILRVYAVEAARQLVTVGPESAAINEWDTQTAATRLRRWLEADVLPLQSAQPYELALSYGVPGIEICRFAERANVDLMVLGRKRHSHMMRLLLGDTADAVARRSRFPCLFVPPGSGEINKVLVALDGTDRGINVLNQSCDFARYTGAAVEAVTVEPPVSSETSQLEESVPLARSVTLEDRVREVLAREGFPNAPLAIRRGEVVERVLAQAQVSKADLLAVGYHRGGLPGVLEAGSIARRLAHVAPSAVLTIPL
jgi:nucleotide-binding universal stress UspA family protein